MTHNSRSPRRSGIGRAWPMPCSTSRGPGTEQGAGRGRTDFDRVSDAYRAVGDERGLARVSFIRGQVLLRAGQLESAIQVLLDALERSASSMTFRISR